MTFLFSFLFLLDAGQNLNVLFLVSWDPCFFSKEPQTFYGYLSNTWLTTNPCRLSQHGPLSLSLLHIPLTGSCQYLQLACPWVLLLKSKKIVLTLQTISTQGEDERKDSESPGSPAPGENSDPGCSRLSCWDCHQFSVPVLAWEGAGLNEGLEKAMSRNFSCLGRHVTVAF